MVYFLYISSSSFQTNLMESCKTEANVELDISQVTKIVTLRLLLSNKELNDC